MACGFVILLSEAYALHRDRLKARPQDYGAAFRTIVSLGSALSEADQRAACRQKRGGVDERKNRHGVRLAWRAGIANGGFRSV